MNEDKYKIDWNDSEALWKFTMDSCRVAEEYREIRAAYGVALKNLKLRLAREYGAGRIERKIAEDKAYLILADSSEECREQLEAIINLESQYKGLEKVMEARQAATSFNQSLIKNEMRNS